MGLLFAAAMQAGIHPWGGKGINVFDLQITPVIGARTE